MLPNCGRAFPDEVETTTPFSITAKEAIAIGSSQIHAKSNVGICSHDAIVEVSSSYELRVTHGGIEHPSPTWQIPFHLAGTWLLIPSSLKLSLSGQTPESITPIMTSSP
jgi:hypothetical protein